ncbi:hypothetical protein H072_10062 [Dactylellina haptotyla CBS 200.50]|uniref:Uncharacterized protein n=1 Tax=Dactylellina haptotyla (strain CBS 200.50) TaxID=1284197 RepID=S8BMJ5_DACHA|nr:hypothetical protein H072_10062 [Dactylellina haptotyla CBS 200.50]
MGELLVSTAKALTLPLDSQCHAVTSTKTIVTTFVTTVCLGVASHAPTPKPQTWTTDNASTDDLICHLQVTTSAGKTTTDTVCVNVPRFGTTNVPKGTIVTTKVPKPTKWATAGAICQYTTETNDGKPTTDIWCLDVPPIMPLLSTTTPPVIPKTWTTAGAVCHLETDSSAGKTTINIICVNIPVFRATDVSKESSVIITFQTAPTSSSINNDGPKIQTAPNPTTLPKGCRTTQITKNVVTTVTRCMGAILPGQSTLKGPACAAVTMTDAIASVSTICDLTGGTMTDLPPVEPNTAQAKTTCPPSTTVTVTPTNCPTVTLKCLVKCNDVVVDMDYGCDCIGGKQVTVTVTQKFPGGCSCPTRTAWNPPARGCKTNKVKTKTKHAPVPTPEDDGYGNNGY